jgi:glycosyltransferase involved in cell wall biosynthesis
LKINVSIVSPVFNEAEGLDTFIQEVKSVLQKTGRSWELLLVDDGSRDNSYSIIENHARLDARIRGVKLTRNFGHQYALSAGLNLANGQYIIMMDSDLQHPPSLIPQMLEQADRGVEIVHMCRLSTKNAGLFKNLSSKLFYYLINKLSDTRIEQGCADFRLIQQKALKALLMMPEKDRFLRGMIGWIGFSSIVLPYNAPERLAGKSSYSLRKMLSLALTSITSFSSRPLHLAFLAGLLSLGIIGIYVLYCIYTYFHHGNVPGWSSLYFTIVFLGGIQLITIGIVGEYIARIYEEVKRRPSYLVAESTDESFHQTEVIELVPEKQTHRLL